MTEFVEGDAGVTVLYRYERRIAAASARRDPTPCGRRLPRIVGSEPYPCIHSILVRHQYQRLELTLRRWKVSGPTAHGVLQIGDDNAEFLKSEDAYASVVDRRSLKRCGLVLDIADAIDRLGVDRNDQAKWIRRPLVPAGNKTPLVIMQSGNSYLNWFIVFLQNRTYFG